MDFGDRSRPNVPRAFCFYDGLHSCAIAGSSLLFFEKKKQLAKVHVRFGNVIYACIMDVCLPCASTQRVLLVLTDARTVELYHPHTGEYHQTIALRSRLVSVCPLPYDSERVVVADKAGSVRIMPWQTILDEQKEVLKEMLIHRKQNPRDVSNLQAHDAIVKLVDPHVLKEAYNMAEQASSDKSVGQLVRPHNEVAVPARSSTGSLTEANSAPDAAECNKFDSGLSSEKLREIYNREMGDPVSWLGHVSTITKMVVCELGGRQYCVTCDKDEKIWVSKLPEIWEVRAVLCGHKEFVLDVLALNGRNWLVSAAGDSTLRLWDVGSRRQLSCLHVPDIVYAMTSIPDAVEAGAGAMVSCLMVSSNALLSVQVAPEGALRIMSTVCLPEVPVALASAALSGSPAESCAESAAGERLPETVVWISVTGGVWMGVERMGNLDSDVLFARLWKHDREPGALTVSQRKEKRLRRPV